MNTAVSGENNAPLYAGCRRLALDAPFRWLKKGWQDFRRAPLHSLAYGVIFTAIGWLLIYLSWVDMIYFLLGLFVAVLVVGPALAFGLYDASRQIELNRKPSFRHERRKALHEMGHELMLALWLSLTFMVLLLLIATVMDVVVAPPPYPVRAAVPMTDTAFLVVAVVFGVLLFCISAFALPMIVDQDATAVTAIATSLNAVWRNKGVIALWALLVLVLAAAGFATALAGFTVIAPVLGYATWHAYREAIATGGRGQRY